MCSCVVAFCQNYAGQSEIRLRAAYRATRQRVLDHDTVFDDGYSADQHAADTGGGAGAVDVRGVVGDSLGVENEDVASLPGLIRPFVAIEGTDSSRICAGINEQRAMISDSDSSRRSRYSVRIARA